MAILDLQTYENSLLRLSEYSGPEGALISKGFSKTLRKKFYELFLRGQGNLESAMTEVRNCIAAHTREAIQLTLESEDSRKQEGGYKSQTMPFTDLVNGTEREADEEILIPESFLRKIGDDLEAAGFPKHLLDIAADSAIRDHMLPLLRKVNDLSTSWETSGMDETLLLLRSEADNENLGLNPENAHKLFFLCSLPYQVRHAVQELLFHRTLIRFCEIEVQKYKGRPEIESFFISFIEALRIGMFLESHWEDLLKRFGASEQLIGELAEEKMRFRELQVLIQNAVKNDEIRNVLVDIHSFTSNLEDRARRTYREASHTYEMLETDIGHTFDIGMIDHEFGYRVGKDMESLAPEKNGRTAIILEDDRRQMDQHKSLVKNFTRYSLAPGNSGIFLNAEDFLDDENAGLYLLDIQNGQDKEAGIRICFDVIDRKIDECIKKGLPKPNAGRDLYCEIILWSRSTEAVKLAKELFTLRYKSDKNWGKYCNSLTSSASEPISICICLKSDDLYLRQKYLPNED